MAPAAARRGLRLAGLAAGMGWLLATAEFAAARIRPGPRDRKEIVTMALTSVVIPPLAIGHWTAGWLAHRHAGPWPPRPAVVLFDRDGTLIHDVPYNGDPELVTLKALRLLRPVPPLPVVTPISRRPNPPKGTASRRSDRLIKACRRRRHIDWLTRCGPMAGQHNWTRAFLKRDLTSPTPYRSRVVLMSRPTFTGKRSNFAPHTPPRRIVILARL